MEEDHIHESILFGFPGTSDETIFKIYCILYAKHYIYLEKLKYNNQKLSFNIVFLGYLCYFKPTMKIGKNICYKKNNYQIC